MKKQLLDIINDKLLKETEFILLNEGDYYILYYIIKLLMKRLQAVL